jgi:hypothetical protein
MGLHIVSSVSEDAVTVVGYRVGPLAQKLPPAFFLEQ